MIRYHPVIAFKRVDEIIKHIANCVQGESKYYSKEKKGDFDFFINNCEHFANRCVVGLDFSELGEKLQEKEKGIKRERELNITEHLGKTKSKLDELGDNVSRSGVNDTKNKIREYRRGSGYENFEVMRDGIKMDACIEVQPSKYLFKEMYQNFLNRYK